MKHKRAKQLYVDGNSISSVATAVGVTRTTIYTYKSKDLKQGIDWDELRYLKQTSATATKGDEKRFLATLVQSFENEMASLETIEEPKERLKVLTQFVNAYYKIKSPNKGDVKGAKASGASDAIYALSQLAMELGNHGVVNFLSENHDVVIERVLSSIKS